MKKVCVWCERWGSGGIESFIINFLSAMDKEGLEIKLVTATEESTVFDKRLSELGVEKRVIFDENITSAIVRNLKTPAALKRVFKEEHFEVIHLNIYHGAALYYGKLAKKAGIKTIILHSHNASLRPSLLRFFKIFVHKIAVNTVSKYGTHYCACSDLAAKWMFPKNVYQSGKVKLIANGVDLERFRFQETQREACRNELDLNDAFTVCCVGRICDQKNQRFLLEIFSEILKIHPNSALLLVGADDSGGEIKELAKSMKIDEKVRFLGVTDKIPQILWASDAFVLPSLFEGNPVSGIEAQASGIPCFFSDAITKEAKLIETTGFLCLTDSSETWAKTILKAEHCVRQDVSEVIRRKGYDIHDSAEILGRLYRS